MFKYRSIRDQLADWQAKNRILMQQLERAQSDVDYIAMMTDVELEQEDEDAQQTLSESEEVL